jgi:hypothetical protein
VTTNTETSGFATSGGESTSFSVLHDRFADPVDARIVSDHKVLGVNKNNLVVFVGGILIDPVRVQHTQVTSNSAHTLLSNTSEVSGEFELIDSLVSGLSVDNTLGNRALTTTSADSNTVDNKTLREKMNKKKQKGKKELTCLALYPSLCALSVLVGLLTLITFLCCLYSQALKRKLNKQEVNGNRR